MSVLQMAASPAVHGDGIDGAEKEALEMQPGGAFFKRRPGAMEAKPYTVLKYRNRQPWEERSCPELHQH